MEAVKTRSFPPTMQLDGFKGAHPRLEQCPPGGTVGTKRGQSVWGMACTMCLISHVHVCTDPIVGGPRALLPEFRTNQLVTVSRAYCVDCCLGTSLGTSGCCAGHGQPLCCQCRHLVVALPLNSVGALADRSGTAALVVLVKHAARCTV
jgi:hypothetical protein